MGNNQSASDAATPSSAARRIEQPHSRVVDEESAKPTRPSSSGNALRNFQQVAGLVRDKTRYLHLVMKQFRAHPRRGGILSWLHAERKTIFFFVLHFIATMITWQHFMYTKFKVQEAKVPKGANLYWWKRLVPPFEFGAMHAILLQMALLPLTMARHSVAMLSETFVAKLIPFQRMTAMHIHLGYTMVTMVFLSTVLFFIFFGQGCAQQHSGREPTPGGVKTFCDKMKSEIMCTGYGILGALLIVGATSYLRDKIRYEYFYVVHHLVFVMFALAIAHTLDDAARNKGQVRSQTFKWFAASLVWYFADRCFMVMGTVTMDVVEWRALGGDTVAADDTTAAAAADVKNDSERSSSQTRPVGSGKVLILRLRRPSHWKFRPGQYASLSASDILGGDLHWHPFSIASSPNEPTVDFYIEVQKEGSWTDRLWQAARRDPIAPPGPDGQDGVGVLNDSDNDNDNYHHHPPRRVRVQGPFGVALADFDDYKHIVAIGSGTGIVPMISLLKSTYAALFQLHPEAHARGTAELYERTREYFAAASKRRYSLGGAAWRRVFPSKAEEIARQIGANDDDVRSISRAQLGFRIKRLKESGSDSATFRGLIRSRDAALRAKAARAALLLLPVLEFTAAGFGLSWSVLHAEATPLGRVVSEDMKTALQAMQIAAVVTFGIFWFTRVSVKSEAWWADGIVLGASAAAVGLWSDMKEWAEFDVYQRLAFVALGSYRFARVWMHVSLSGDLFTEALRANREGAAAVPVDSFKLVFVTRNAFFAQHLWPELDRLWSRLESTWGKYSCKVSRIVVYVTERDVDARLSLEKSVEDTALYRSGALRFGRPSFPDELNAHMLDLVAKDKMAAGGNMASSTSTLVAFCGGPNLATCIDDSVNDAVAAVKMVAGESDHSMEFVSENFGHAGKMDLAKVKKSAEEAVAFERQFTFNTFERGR